LVELLVVIGIIGVLAAVILPAVNGARESAQRTRCQNNMRQVALATLQYDTQFKKLPPARTRAPNGAELHGFLVHILSNLEEKTVVDRYDFKKPWNQNPASEIPVAAFVCGSVGEERGAITDYSPIIGVHGAVYDAIRAGQKRHPKQPARMSPKPLNHEPGIVLDVDSRRTAKVLDGMTHTILLAESGGRPQFYIANAAPPSAPAVQGRWAAPQSSIMVNICSRSPATGIPNPNQAQPAMMNFINGFGAAQQPGPEIYSFHSGGGNFAFGDASVRFIADTISEDALISLLTAQDGDVVDSAFLEQ
jgi:prepilin-type processing-associated H-X9-DG protein